MIDIKFLRENPEVVKQNIRNKFQDNKLPLVDEVIALDEQLRQNKKRADDLRANRNKVSKSIGMLMGQKKFEEAEEAKKLVAAQAEELAKIVLVEKTDKKGNTKKIVNRDCVGRDADVILAKIGIKVSKDIRCIICETDFNHPFVQEELM